MSFRKRFDKLRGNGTTSDDQRQDDKLTGEKQCDASRNEANLVSRLNARIDNNPFGTWLGMRVVEARQGYARTETAWREEFGSTRESGAVHGGILASLLDACSSAAISTITDRVATTVDLRVDYHCIAKQGQLITEAQVIRSGGSIATVDAVILDQTGVRAASARGTFAHAKTQL